MINRIWYNVNVIVSALCKLGLEYSQNVLASTLTSIRCGGVVDLLIKPKSTIELIDVLSILKEHSIPAMPMGAGTNTIVSDLGYRGALISLNKFNKINLDSNRLFAESGVSLPYLAHKTATIGLKGLEQLSGIPGNIGGVVAKNAGCFGKEIADLITSVTYLDMLTLKEEVVNRQDIPYSYRSSSDFFKDKIVLSTTLNLTKSNDNLLNEIQRYRTIRLAHQPTEPSLGSVFKKTNDGKSAGYYIDQANLKGTRIGNAMISTKHANFIVNVGGATANEYLELATLCAETVKDKFNINLTKEIDIIGEYHIDK